MRDPRLAAFFAEVEGYGTGHPTDDGQSPKQLPISRADKRIKGLIEKYNVTKWPDDDQLPVPRLGEEKARTHLKNVPTAPSGGYLPNMRVVYVAMDGFARFYEAVIRRDPKLASYWAERLVKDEDQTRTYIGECVTSLITTLGLSVADIRDAPLEISRDGKFLTELQLELLARIPMAPVEGGVFLNQLYADLYSHATADGSLRGAWGELVAVNGELQISLSQTLQHEIEEEVADLVAAGKGRTAARIHRKPRAHD